MFGGAKAKDAGLDQPADVGVLCLRRAARRNCSPYCLTIAARRLQPNADTAALIDKSALGRYPPNDIFRSQYPRHFAATLTRIFASNAICGVKLL